MKKFKLMAVIAVAGALGLSARATTVTNADAVTIQATITLQSDNTEKGDTTKFNVTKVKVVTKDVLGLIDDEFGTTFANTNGTQLAVASFFDENSFEVLDKKGNVLIADASTDSDDYGLSINTEDDNNVVTGSETETAETDDYTAISEFEYNSADDESFLDIRGSATVKDSFNDTKETDSESFDFSGVGNAEINEDDGVATVSVSGKGTNGDFGD